MKLTSAAFGRCERLIEAAHHGPCFQEPTQCGVPMLEVGNDRCDVRLYVLCSWRVIVSHPLAAHIRRFAIEMGDRSC